MSSGYILEWDALESKIGVSKTRPVFLTDMISLIVNQLPNFTELIGQRFEDTPGDANVAGGARCALGALVCEASLPRLVTEGGCERGTPASPPALTQAEGLIQSSFRW